MHGAKNGNFAKCYMEIQTIQFSSLLSLKIQILFESRITFSDPDKRSTFVLLFCGTMFYSTTALRLHYCTNDLAWLFANDATKIDVTTKTVMNGSHRRDETVYAGEGN